MLVVKRPEMLLPRDLRMLVVKRLEMLVVKRLEMLVAKRLEMLVVNRPEMRLVEYACCILVIICVEYDYNPYLICLQRLVRSGFFYSICMIIFTPYVCIGLCGANSLIFLGGKV